MGGYSSRHEHYIHKFSNPCIDERNQQRMVHIPAGGGNIAWPFEPLARGPDETAIITDVALLFVDNRNDDEVILELSSIFDKEPSQPGVISSNEHPDDSARILIHCPAHYNGQVLGNNCRLYTPRLKRDWIMQYAGLDAAIAQCPQDLSVFDMSHPIVTVVRNHFASEPGHRRLEESNGAYHIEPALLKEAIGFFGDTVGKALHYTHLDHCKLSTLQAPSKHPVSLILQINYLAVTPGSSMAHSEQRVNL